MIEAYDQWIAGGAQILLTMATASTVFLGLAYIATAFLPRTSAATRHAIWLLADSPSPLASSAISRHGDIANTQLGLETRPSEWAAGVIQYRSPNIIGTFWFSIITTWMIGVLIMVVRLIYAHVAAWRLLAQSEAGELAGVLVRFCDRLMVPITLGVVRPKILMPTQSQHWPEDELRAVLAHELAHVDRIDGFSQLIVSVVKCIAWFQPLAWLGNHRMALEREIACDDRVLKDGVEGSFYAATLL